MTKILISVTDMNWMALDVRQLPFPDRSMAAVVEKGTMDALLRKGDDCWLDMCKECSRVLPPGEELPSLPSL
eukprot:381749-Hanusia_phi.AAC.1